MCISEMGDLPRFWATDLMSRVFVQKNGGIFPFHPAFFTLVIYCRSSVVVVVFKHLGAPSNPLIFFGGRLFFSIKFGKVRPVQLNFI